MSEPIKITLTPDAQRHLASLPTLPARLPVALCRALDEQNELTVGYIDEHYLSGPRPDKLGVLTNRLRSAVRKSAAVPQGDRILSAIGAFVKYAGFHEYGFQGTEQVREHARRIFQYSRKPAGARVNKHTGEIIEPKRKRLKTVGQCIVKAHSRQVNYAGRPYLHPGIRDRRREYGAALSAAVCGAFTAKEGGAS